MSKKNGYPIKVFPHPSYRRRLGLERLLFVYQDLMAVRQVEGEPKEYEAKGDAGGSFIMPSVFNCNMANLSLNLAGGLFNVKATKDLRFLPKTDEATAPWNGCAPHKEICQEYRFSPKCFGLCFLIRKVHRRTFPFLRHFDNQKKRDEYAEEVQKVSLQASLQNDAKIVGLFDSKLKAAEVRPRIMVHHSPTMANYWHLTLDTYRPTETNFVKPDDKQSNQDKKMFIALKQDLVHHCRINLKPNYKIRRFDFKKPYTRFDYLIDCFQSIVKM